MKEYTKGEGGITSGNAPNKSKQGDDTFERNQDKQRRHGENYGVGKAGLKSLEGTTMSEALELATELATSDAAMGTMQEAGLGRNFEDSLAAHLEWKVWDVELNLLLWHGESSYFPMAQTVPDGTYDNPTTETVWGDVACNCGCGQEYLNLELYNRLTWARVLAGIPFNILSWNRCEKHNLAEGGSSTSSHLLGYAVDIRINNSIERFKILKALLDAGFTRIGIYSWGFHVDVDPEKDKEVCWLKQ